MSELTNIPNLLQYDEESPTPEEKKVTRPHLVDLFPYRVKNINNFYQRNHPVDVHPKSIHYKRYWLDFIKKCVEGEWIWDCDIDDEKDGQWVWMTPKLYRYINYAKINNNKKDLVYPDLRPSEFILFYYIQCTLGFSGFEDDKEYTCHELIKLMEIDPSKVSPYQKRTIPENTKKADGTYKTYVEPWHYLTRFYLVENPTTKPLGLPLYDNPLYNGMIGACRGIGKTLVTFVGDLEHSIQLGGITRMSDFSKANRRKLYMLASATSNHLQRSVNNLRMSYFNAPGGYAYPDFLEIEPNRGPLYKKLQGSWEVGKELKHVNKSKSGATELLGASLQMSALTANRLTVAAGDRMDVYVEEAFFVEGLINLHSNLRDTLQVDGEQVNRVMYLGTGGKVKSIKESMAMMLNPAGYNIFGIPDYWGNPANKIGLFIPKTYAVKEARDHNNNIDLEYAYDWVLKERAKKLSGTDSVSYNKDIQFNPLTPIEMLQPSGNSMFPKKEAQEQLIKLDSEGIYQRQAQVGYLYYDPSRPKGVRWDKDLNNVLQPIHGLTVDEHLGTKDGAIIIYEPPNEKPPKNLNWILYDPAKKDGDGESFHAAIVYKYMHTSQNRTLYDTIVGEYVGRRLRLEDNYHEVIKLAKYYNARIFVETNVAGFVNFCERQNLYHMLESDAFEIEQEINPNAKRNKLHPVGCNMNIRKKIWAIKKLRGWLSEIKEKDPKTGLPILTTMDWIFSKRALNEIIAFHPTKGNYDVISCLLLLMVLLEKLERLDLSISEVEETPDLPYMDYIYTTTRLKDASKRKRKRATFLNY